ncbi:MAG: hypothetical protein M3220_12705 [Chloroflexota bacterium]|nr:hypothetical protein [Chloroflexota bacterium]
MAIDNAHRGKLTLLMLSAFFLLACGVCSFANPFAGEAEPTVNPAFSGVELGEVVTAGAIGQGNTPQNVRDTFSVNDPIIYVVVEAERVEAGTTLFARWFRDGEPFEDTPAITADRTYTDTFIEFHIEPTTGTQFEPGEYSVQLYVNGNPGPSVDFTVQ